MIGIEERGKADRKYGRRNHETQQRSGTIGAVGGREGCDAGKRGESAFCKTNEGKVKKYRVRFIKGISWAADSVRIFAIFLRGRKMFNLCPYLSNLSAVYAVIDYDYRSVPETLLIIICLLIYENL